MRDLRVKGARTIISMWLIGLVLSSVVVIGCKKEEAKAQANVASDPGTLARGNAGFAINLYGEIRHREGNLFLSPYSISAALAMTSAGARRNTAAQMDQVLRFGLKGESLHATFSTLTDDLNEMGKQGDFELSVANALWGQQGFSFLDPFLDLNKKYYGAGLNLLDFQSDTEGARRTINNWVEKETKEKIKDLLKPGVLNAMTRLVLTNAIYFKGKWAQQFDAESTRDEDFWVTPEKSVKTPMMHQTEDFGYIETESFQALELPYEGDSLSMVVLLPRAKDGLPALEQALDADTLFDWLDRMTEQEVIVALPRFRVTSEFGLAAVLAAMGMEDAFSLEKADFSGMTGKKDLYISAVVHKAFVDVNEEGTEAAAATAVTMMLTAVREMPPVFRADHPFIFLIRDRGSGSLLFMGRLANPEPE
jgi:serpin B